MRYKQNKTDIETVADCIQLQFLSVFADMYPHIRDTPRQGKKAYYDNPHYKKSVSDLVKFAGKNKIIAHYLIQPIDTPSVSDRLKTDTSLNETDRQNLELLIDRTNWDNAYTRYVDLLVDVKREFFQNKVLDRRDYMLKPTLSPCVAAYEKSSPV